MAQCCLRRGCSGLECLDSRGIQWPTRCRLVSLPNERGPRCCHLPRASEGIKTTLVTHALQTEKKVLHNAIPYENHSNVPSRRFRETSEYLALRVRVQGPLCLNVEKEFANGSWLEQCSTWQNRSAPSSEAIRCMRRYGCPEKPKIQVVRHQITQTTGNPITLPQNDNCSGDHTTDEAQVVGVPVWCATMHELLHENTERVHVGLLSVERKTLAHRKQGCPPW